MPSEINIEKQLKFINTKSLIGILAEIMKTYNLLGAE